MNNSRRYIRQATVLIVRRGAEYLVGRIPYSLEFRWSRSPYDAWRTRSRESADKVAGLTGGDKWLFNPIVGQLREVRNDTYSCKERNSA